MAFVEPATAVSNMIAFKRVSFVINCEGLISFLTSSTMYAPASVDFLNFILSSAGIMEVPGITRFSTSPSICIVQAVPIVGHAPNVGHT